MNRTSAARVILLLSVVSGVAALGYEVLFFRSLGLVFGVAVHAISAVVGSFLLGLGLGARLGDRLSARFEPLRAYATIELLIALFGYLAPFLFRALRTAVERGDLPIHSGDGFPLVPLLGSFAVLSIPTLAMGATFPVLVRAITRLRPEREASAVGALYGANTLGAALGTLATAFLVLPTLGMVGAYHTLAGVNLLLAIVTVALSTKREFLSDPDPATTPAESSSRTSESARAENLPLDPKLLLATVAVAGFASVALQILSNRLLIGILGGTVYVFATVLAVFLVGIAFGGAAGGRAAERTNRPVGLLGQLSIAFAGAIGLGLLWLRHKFGGEDLLQGPDNIGLLPEDSMLSEFSPTRYFAIAIGWSAVLLLPATLISGAAFPAACRFFARSSRIGADLGRLYFFNTLGSIVGSLTAAFLLLPALGLRTSFAVIGAISLLLGLILLRNDRSGFTPTRIALSIVCVALLAFGLRKGETPGRADGLRTVFFADSAASSAKVQEVDDISESEPVRLLRVSGKTVASSIFLDRRLQYLLGFVSALAHPEPKRMVCIGLGTGMTSAALAVAGGTLDVVEISPAVIAAVPQFAHWNAELHQRQDTAIHHDDGRAWLARSKERFDVISADPIDPCVSGSAYLYTAEYYELGRRHLAPGGLMSQWIPLYDLATSDIAGIVKTFRSVFPHVSAWVTGYDMMLLGSEAAFAFDPRQLTERMREEPLRTMLSDVGVATAEDFLGCYFAGEETLAQFASFAPAMNTDDHPWIEFHAPRAAFGSYPLEVYKILGRAPDRVPLIPELPESAVHAVHAAQSRLKQGALEFVTQIEGGASYGEARTLYIEYLRGVAGR